MSPRKKEKNKLRIASYCKKIAILLNEKNYSQAKKYCIKILKLDDLDINGNKFIAFIYLNDGKLEVAVKYYQIAVKGLLEIGDEYNALELEMLIIDCLIKLKIKSKLKNHIDKLLIKYPFDKRLLYFKAKNLEVEGDDAQALIYYQQLVNLPRLSNENNDDLIAYAFLAMVRSPNLMVTSNDILQIDNLISNFNINSVNAKSTLIFAKAQVLEGLEQYPEAFKSYQTANSILWSKQECHLADMLKAYKRCISSSWPEKTNLSLESKTSIPIFIEGIPRSGTSLVEAVLTEVPEIKGYGESGYLQDAINSVNDEECLMEGYWSTYPNQMMSTKIREHYSQSLLSDKSEGKYFTDKTVNSFDYIGLKIAAFPQSKFIFTYKSPLDALFSLYRQKFELGQHEYANHAKSCAFMVNLSIEYRNYWRALYPSQVYLFSYEESVLQPEVAWKNLFQWLGIKWQLKYLNFYNSKKEIHTLSASQCRQEITPNYLNRAKKYGSVLKDLEKQLALSLDELADIENY